MNRKQVSAGTRLFVLIVLLGSGVVSWPVQAGAANITGPQSVSAPFGDDVHTSTLNPYPLINVSTIPAGGNTPAGQCSWINAGLDAFKTANPMDGTGPSGQAWSFSWAGVAAEANVESGLSLYSYTFGGNTYDGYNPYVVNQPDVVAANGRNYPSDISNAEDGGAVLNLKYTPGGNAPVLNNLHWIQAYTGTLHGTAFGPILDNDPANPYVAQASDSPFYDAPGKYAAGSLGGGGGWFLDTPFVTESETNETNPQVNSQFQVVLATDTTSTINSGPGGAAVTLNTVTLYGGDWWGYQYTAVDTPEPSTLVLGLGGAVGLTLAGLRVRRRRDQLRRCRSECRGIDIKSRR